MHGKSFQGPLPPATPKQHALARVLRAHVEHLAGEIGERNLTNNPEALERAADWIAEQLRGCGYQPQRQTFGVRDATCQNLDAERKGTTLPDEIVLVGAHYDSVEGTAGANDNGSGVAALLALAAELAHGPPTARSVRLVWFTNEEPPYFQGPDMGSVHYADRSAARGEHIVAMLSLEMMGYYSDAPDTQEYPALLQAFYPSTGNFISFVANLQSRALMQRALASFRSAALFPSEGAALPEALPGIGWSDHWAFWRHDVPAIMITDTAPYRYPHYHTARDTPDKLDYDRLARVTEGLSAVLRALADER